MKKRLKFAVAFTMVLCMLFSILTISAGAVQSEISAETVYFEDGSYMVITLEMSSANVRASTRSASKTASYHNSSGELQYSFTLNGTFSYDGSSATATASSTSYQIYNSDWRCTTCMSSKSGNSVTGTATFKKSIWANTKDLKITCSPTGVIS